MSRNRLERYLPPLSVHCRVYPPRPPYRGLGLNRVSRKCLEAQFVEQCFGLFQIGGVEAFGEPGLDFGEASSALPCDALALYAAVKDELINNTQRSVERGWGRRAEQSILSASLLDHSGPHHHFDQLFDK
jgi:hypothetical protein